MNDLRTMFCVLCFLLAPLVAYTQVQPGIAQSAPDSQSLAAALATAIPFRQHIYLTVAAENVSLPQGSIMPPSGSTLTTISDVYRRSVRAFGAITAIAPPTMFVLNAHLDNSNMYAQLQSEQALKLLAASLNDAQWKDMIGEHGLGVSDLADENQRRLFAAIFPGGSLHVSGQNPTAPNPDMDLSGEISQVRLRLGQSVHISLPVQGKTNTLTGISFLDESPYVWMHGFIAGDLLQGLSPSADVPNVLKPGQLDWSLPVLRAPVALSGLKTVGDLIGRVAEVAHLELYADKRYEGKTLTIIGDVNSSVPATDLLRALAFCVTGTFRQVGPAYVLTDDVIGLETRRTLLKCAGQESKQQVHALLNKAADVFGTKRSFRELTGQDDPLALSAEERAKIPDIGDGPISNASLALSLNQLTQAQQDNVRRQSSALTQSDSGQDANIPDLEGKMQLEIQPQLELLIPSLDHPVTTNLSLHNLFAVSPKYYREHLEKHPPVTSRVIPVTSLPKSMALTVRRALLVQPKTAAELAGEITQMTHLGFNELWLSVFSQGQRQTSLPHGDDLLTQALRLTHGKGIRVYAVIDLFQWGIDAPSDAVDLDPLGETSAQAETLLSQEALAEANADGVPPPPSHPKLGLSVTLFDPVVIRRLQEIVSIVAQRPGLAGIVLRQTAPEGYDNQRDLTVDASEPDLGYGLASRLAFLRQQHTDPLDISKARIMGSQGGQSMGMNGVMVSSDMGINSLPGTDIPYFNDTQIDAQLSIAWDKFRRDADLNVMQSLYSVAKTRNPNFLIYVEQRHSDYSPDWYGSWDRPTAPLPEWTLISYGPESYRVDHMAKQQSHLALVGIDASAVHDLPTLAFVVSDTLEDSTWDGFVWDVSQLKAPVLNQSAPTK